MTTILAKAIQAYSQKHDIPYREISRLSGVNVSTLSRYINGEQMNVENYLRIINWLNQDERAQLAAQGGE